MLKQQVENKGRVPAEAKRVRVTALQDFDDHPFGQQFKMDEGKELTQLIAEGKVRIDEGA